MSLLTDFLKLFKYDPETDRDKTFNITQALNENWDKIDADKKAQDDAIATKETPAGAQQKADAAESSAKAYTDQEVANVENDLIAHKAENVQQGNSPHGIGSVAAQDYEEGTFTPNLLFGGSSNGITYGSRLGAYIKIGKKIHYQIEITVTHKGSSVGLATISGFPFVFSGIKARHVVAIGKTANLIYPTGTTVLSIDGLLGTPIAQMSASGDGLDFNAVDNTHFTDSTTLRFSGTYII